MILWLLMKENHFLFLMINIPKIFYQEEDAKDVECEAATEAGEGTVMAVEGGATTPQTSPQQFQFNQGEQNKPQGGFNF